MHTQAKKRCFIFAEFGTEWAAFRGDHFLNSFRPFQNNDTRKILIKTRMSYNIHFDKCERRA